MKLNLEVNLEMFQFDFVPLPPPPLSMIICIILIVTHFLAGILHLEFTPPPIHPFRFDTQYKYLSLLIWNSYFFVWSIPAGLRVSISSIPFSSF